jgi:hypothetical protein
MKNQDSNIKHEDCASTSRSAFWLRLSIPAAVLAMGGNAIGLTTARIYAGLTPAFLPQALAQDAVSLVLVSPAWLILAVLALRGSLRALLLWLGVLTFTFYNYVIYAFSVPFGPLFPVWVAVLGLSLFSLIGGIVSLDHEKASARFTKPAAVRGAAWFLIVMGALFGLLWLSEDVPALLTGRVPKSVIDMALPTNPVHVLDLSFFLPAVIAAGVLALRGNPLARVLATPFIVFLALTGMPILATPVVQAVRGEAAAWGMVIPIGTIVAVSLGFLIPLLSTMRRRT